MKTGGRSFPVLQLYLQRGKRDMCCKPLDRMHLAVSNVKAFWLRRYWRPAASVARGTGGSPSRWYSGDCAQTPSGRELSSHGGPIGGIKWPHVTNVMSRVLNNIERATSAPGRSADVPLDHLACCRWIVIHVFECRVGRRCWFCNASVDTHVLLGLRLWRMKTGRDRSGIRNMRASEMPHQYTDLLRPRADFRYLGSSSWSSSPPTYSMGTTRPSLVVHTTPADG